MSLFIESSKTDKFREGAWLLIARTNTELCPVSNLEKYIKWTGLEKDSDRFLFCRMSALKSGYKIRKENKHLSYTNFRNMFLQTFSPIVTDIKKYCLHSLRAGGATAAANNGIPDRLFKHQGRWLSESAKDGYVLSSVEERLRVSLS